MDSYQNQLDPRVFSLAKKEIEKTGTKKLPKETSAKSKTAPKKKTTVRKRKIEG